LAEANWHWRVPFLFDKGAYMAGYFLLRSQTLKTAERRRLNAERFFLNFDRPFIPPSREISE